MHVRKPDPHRPSEGGSWSYTYDGTLLKTDTRSGILNQAIGYTYNNDFRITSMTYAGATQSLTYDNDGLLTNAGPFSITRDAQNGLPTSTSDGTMTDTRTFSGYGELDGDSYTIGSNNKYSWSVTRDQSGRITQKVENISGGADTYDYKFDNNGRLLQVKKNSVVVESYGYDADGNRQSDISRTYSYAADDHIMTAGNTTYQFNVDGSLTSKTSGSQSTTYQYSSRGELLKVTKPDSTLITYEHDPMGRRISKRINGDIVEKYLWASSTKLLAVYDGNNNLVSRFTYADGRMPVSMTKNAATYYLSYDQIGSLRAVSDNSGNIVKRVDYDSFGNILNDSNTAFKVPFGFAGGLHDRDTGLVRFGARDYDPGIGRWTAKDPIDFSGGDINLFGYVGNNPVIGRNRVRLANMQIGGSNF